jgi:hypothetical protein
MPWLGFVFFGIAIAIGIDFDLDPDLDFDYHNTVLTGLSYE